MTPPFPAVAPSDDIAFVLQGATLAALVGAAVAARRRRRDPSADAWLLTTRWSLAGAGAALMFVVLFRVLS